MTNILVLGTGHIGSEIVFKFSGKNNVTCIDHGKNFPQIQEKCPQVNLVKGDCFDYNLIKKYAKDIDTIFFCSGTGGVYDCMNEPAKFFESNVTKFQKLLKILEEIKKFEFYLFSTNFVYANILKITEESILSPTTEYGKLRLKQEKILRNTNFEYTILRLSNIFGYGNFMNCGNLGAVEKFIQKGFSEHLISLHGDGSQKLDLLYKEDLMSLLEILMKNKPERKTYNISTGNQLSISQVAEIIKKIIFKSFKIEIKIDKSNPDLKFPNAPLMSHNKITNEIGWQPNSDVSEKIENMIQEYGLGHKR
jgi:nucleoside-diphosphate-sugar epimerase